MNNKLIIIGSGGHGKVVADAAHLSRQWETIAFLDDNRRDPVLGYEVVGGFGDAEQYYNHADFFVAIGSNTVRKAFLTTLTNQNVSIAKIIHPTAIIASDVEIGVGTIVMPGSVINAGSRIGDGCIVNTASIVEHDNTIGDFVHLSPGVILAGTVKIGDECWLGVGSVVSNNIDICAKTILGAGSVVIGDIKEPGTYVGVPVRKLK